ncbi:MAG TPA: hypothetical protein VMJ65_26715 [Solirubrobacteraceae bacterium]|nr:hypothetical protein [Solirubrobacteraceae bacterium]
MSLPAVEAGLDLDHRVVRRHVARLEAAGWLGRAPWVWGEGSVAWLTGLGVESSGLGGLRAVKAPPALTTIAHGVLVGWSAARAEKHGRVWRSARELALEPDRWEVTVRCERGYTTQLPDLAVWLKRSGPPIALISESGGRREDRQKKILEGWRNAVYAGQYSAVLYDCANDSVAHLISRLAAKVQLTRSKFGVVIQARAQDIATLSPAATDDEAALSHPQNSPKAAPAIDKVIDTTDARAPVSVAPAPPEQSEPRAAPEAETAEEAAERERRYREIFGTPEPKRRRPWRRSHTSWPGTT